MSRMVGIRNTPSTVPREDLIAEGAVLRVSKPGLEQYKYRVRYIDAKYFTKVIAYLEKVD